jgi:hypothetical protein
MTRIELFIKEKSISTTKMETDLGLPARSIQIHRGIPRKYIDVIEGYLEENYGYECKIPIVSSVVEVDKPVGTVEVKKIWNVNFVPDYKDGIERFQSSVGLWRRYKDTVTSINKETGEIKIIKGYEKINDIIYEGEFGSYWLCVNGTKVYKFEKV